MWGETRENINTPKLMRGGPLSTTIVLTYCQSRWRRVRGQVLSVGKRLHIALVKQNEGNHAFPIQAGYSVCCVNGKSLVFVNHERVYITVQLQLLRPVVPLAALLLLKSVPSQHPKWISMMLYLCRPDRTRTLHIEVLAHKPARHL